MKLDGNGERRRAWTAAAGWRGPAAAVVLALLAAPAEAGTRDACRVDKAPPGAHAMARRAPAGEKAGPSRVSGRNGRGRAVRPLPAAPKPYEEPLPPAG